MLDGGKLPISQEEFFVHEATNYRLLRYSIFGWDKFSISQEEFFVHEATNYRLLRYSTFGGTSSLPQEDTLVYKTTTRQLLRHPIFGQDKVPIPKDLVTQEMTIHRLLRTRFSEDSKLLKLRRNPPSSKRQLVNYDSTRPKGDKLSIKGFLT